MDRHISQCYALCSHMVTNGTECIGPYIAGVGTDSDLDLPGRGPGWGYSAGRMCTSASSLVPGLKVLLEW